MEEPGLEDSPKPCLLNLVDGIKIRRGFGNLVLGNQQSGQAGYGTGTKSIRRKERKKKKRKGEKKGMESKPTEDKLAFEFQHPSALEPLLI